MHMLDTDCFSYIVRGDIILTDTIRRVSPREICISAICYSEVFYGLSRIDPGHSLWRRTRALLEQVNVLTWDLPAADHFASIRRDLVGSGRGIGILDMMIAAHARSLGATLVTNNLRHFSRVEGLHIDNWMNPPDPDGLRKH